MIENEYNVESRFSPLEISLILCKIYDFLPPRSVLVGRLVNKFWFDQLSPRLTLILKEKEDFEKFLEFRNIQIENENENENEKNEDSSYLSVPYRKFNFTSLSWLDSENPCHCQCPYQSLCQCNHDCPLDLQTTLNQLVYLTNIREISLFDFNVKNWACLLKILATADTLLILNVDIFKMESNNKIFPDDEDLEDEDSFILKNLKTLRLRFEDAVTISMFYRSPEKPKAENKFIKDLLLAGSWAKELEIDCLYSNVNCYILEYIVDLGLKLGKLKIKNWSIGESEKIVLKLIEMAQNKLFWQIDLDDSLIHAEFLQDFLQIVSIYYYAFPNILKSIKNYLKIFNLQIENVKKVPLYYKIPVLKTLYHFPQLEFLDLPSYYSSINHFNSLDSLLLKEEEEDEKETRIFVNLKYLKCTFDNPAILENCTEKLTTFFPNLTTLKINIKPGLVSTSSGLGLNLAPIFLNLKKLEVFSYNSGDYFISDSDLTGIHPEFIKNHLLDKPYEWLEKTQIQDFIKAENQIGIYSLKELRELNLINCEKLTEISLFFGFRFLPKLRQLGNIQLANIKKEHLSIFGHDFLNLEILNIGQSQTQIWHSFPLNLEIIEIIKAKKPCLTIIS